MTKQQKKILLLAILIPVMVVLLFSASRAIRGRRTPPREHTQLAEIAPKIKGSPTAPVKDSIPEEDYLKMENISRLALKPGTKWERDPFLIPHQGPEKEQLGIPELKGFIEFDGHPYVLINGKTYEEGDSVQGFKVIKINRDSAILEKGGHQITIWMD